MTGTGAENALSKLVDLLSCDNDVAQETKEIVLLNLWFVIWAVFLKVY